jgi:O-antigen/teichoic acid export membrane protein
MLIAAHLERILLVCAVSILALNIALNLVLIPMWGYNAAAATSVASEAVSLVLSLWFVRRRLQFTYPFHTLRVVLPAAAAMAAVVLVLPVPRVAAVVIGVAVYCIIVVSLPGVARDTTCGLVTSALERTRMRTS